MSEPELLADLAVREMLLLDLAEIARARDIAGATEGYSVALRHVWARIEQQGTCTKREVNLVTELAMDTQRHILSMTETPSDDPIDFKEWAARDRARGYCDEIGQQWTPEQVQALASLLTTLEQLFWLLHQTARLARGDQCQ